jgi:hypothetical protein
MREICIEDIDMEEENKLVIDTETSEEDSQKADIMKGVRFPKMEKDFMKVKHTFISPFVHPLQPI